MTWDYLDIAFELSTVDEIVDGATQDRPLRVFKEKRDIPDFLKERIWSLKPGSEFRFELEPELCFGKVNQDLKIEIEVPKMPERFRSLNEGDILEMKGPDKKLRPFRIIQKSASHIVVDGNHPLAGQRLSFEGLIVKAGYSNS
jgi:FKBP-type peptidyl-prolyl cis-trans isomerase SlyD